MKKITLALSFIFLFAIAAFGQEDIQAATYENPILLDEPNKVEQLAEPYENICMQLSNGKDDVLKILRAAVLPKLDRPEAEVLQSIGEAAAGQYVGDPKLGMAKFCMNCLDGEATVERQAQIVAAFAKGYKGCGVVIISRAGCDKEPATKAQLYSGAQAWFIPFTTGTNLKFNIFGKTGETARVWKISADNAVCKQWQGGFWEREITLKGK